MSLEIPIAVGVLVAVVALANLAERRAALRPLLHAALQGLNVGLFLSVALLPGATPLAIALGFAFSLAASLVLLRTVRERLAGLFPRRNTTFDPQTGALAGRSGFDPDSMVHMTALVLAVYLVANTVLSYTLAGGLAGLAEQLSAASGGLDADVTSPASLIMQMAIFLLFAALGAGFGTRRSLPDTLERLGLRAPTLRELGAGIGMAFVLFWTVLLIGSVWQLLVPPETLEEQTQLSGLIAASIDTMTAALLLSLTAAIGEEIAFRGALQPTFGLLPTAILFTLTHIQYTLTPATLAILVVGLGFGYVRQRFNTTTAIVTHFLYNGTQLAILLYGRYLFDLIQTVQ
ncbi:MAG: CPBP family intramembrane metalloprotease [Anaerolineae bacterium]|nr:CPBP family intramembrane metalloprotease [Anaerolineae bacterium]